MRFLYLSAVLSAVILMSSCSSSKNSIMYFEDISESDSGEYPQGDYSVKIVPDDELLITVTSMEPGATAMYNLPLANPATRSEIMMQTQPQQQTYRVDKAGNIDFPVLGKLHVEGMTTQEITDDIASRISSEVADPVVRVELVNFRINVLGEVVNPRSFRIERERYSVIDALADAGGLTPYGERTKVLLIREDNGKRVWHHLNLNDSKLMESPYFYLQQNDVLIVQPNKIRQDNAKYNQNNAYKLSVISTVVSACSIIASLVIALVVK